MEHLDESKSPDLMDLKIPPEVQPILRLRAGIAAVLRTSAQLRNHNFPFTTLDDSTHRRSRTQRPQASDRRVAQSLVTDLRLAMEELLRVVECMPSRSVERYGTSIDASRRQIDAHSLPPLGDYLTDWMEDNLHPIKTTAEDLWQPIDSVHENPVETRWMLRRDLPEVAEIDAFSSPQPWDEETFRRRILRPRYRIGLVASAQDQIVASLGICRHRGHRRILRFGMHPDFRSNLAAIALLNCERRELAPERQMRIIMDVRENDRYLCELLQTRHFRSRILRGAFGEEDGVRFTQSLLPPAQLIVDHAEQFAA